MASYSTNSPSVAEYADLTVDEVAQRPSFDMDLETVAAVGEWIREPGRHSATFAVDITPPTASVPIVTSHIGADSRGIERAIDRGVDGIVLEATGVGNTTAAVGDAVETAIEAGVPVVVASHCVADPVAPVYGTAGGGQTLRDPTPDETARIREMVDSAMTTSYRLSPEQIDAITAVEFSDDSLMEMASDDTRLAVVADNGSDTVDTAVAGVVVGGVADGVGEIRWLFVDPEHRGAGVGTALFEAAVEWFRSRDVGHVQVKPLETGIDGAQFAERFDFVRTAERRVEFGDETLVEYVYTEPEAASGTTDAAETETATNEFPDTEVRGGRRTATDDGQRVYLDTGDDRSGSERAIFPTYTDSGLTESYGYYCANCGSVDVMMDDMTRLECPDCGHSHASRSTETDDDSYL